jgi:hypothetical protein
LFLRENSSWEKLTKADHDSGCSASCDSIHVVACRSCCSWRCSCLGAEARSCWETPPAWLVCLQEHLVILAAFSFSSSHADLMLLSGRGARSGHWKAPPVWCFFLQEQMVILPQFYLCSHVHLCRVYFLSVAKKIPTVPVLLAFGYFINNSHNSARDMSTNLYFFKIK